MKITIFQIKLVHTVIFWILSLCVLYALYSGIADRITIWTWIAVGLLLLESIVLAICGWTCPCWADVVPRACDGGRDS